MQAKGHPGQKHHVLCSSCSCEDNSPPYAKMNQEACPIDNVKDPANLTQCLMIESKDFLQSFFSMGRV